MKKKSVTLIIVVLSLLALLAAACAPTGMEPTAPAETPEPIEQIVPPDEPAYVEGEAGIESVEVMILESFPVQVHLLVSGYLSDGCTSLHEITQEREGNEFKVTIATLRDPEAICTMALVPFEETVVLDVEGLEAGDYAVHVNDYTTRLTLDADNVPPDADIGEATEAAEAARRDLAIVAEVEVEAILVKEATYVEWPDGCLGVYEDDIACITVITPGYIVELELEGEFYTYHTNLDGSQVILAEKRVSQ